MLETVLSHLKHMGPICSVSVYVRNIKKCMGILKSLNIVNLYRGMSKLRLKINVKVPHLLCIVVSVALNRDLKHQRRMRRRRRVKLLQDWVEDVVHGARVHVDRAESLQTST